MKQLIKKIIILILTIESRLVLKRFKPRIIGVAGSVGKTSTKDAIFSALSKSIHIRKNQKSFNSDIGVPLTILGLDNGFNNILIWIKNIFLGFTVLFSKKYPKWLVLELGTDHPGDMDKLIKWIKLDFAVFTRLPKVPVHVEYFSSPKEINDEDKKMLKGLKKDGIVVLNADDPLVMEIRNETKNLFITYGIDEAADIRVANQNIVYRDSKPFGLNFKIEHKNNSIPINIDGVLGKQHIYPVAASIAVGVSLEISILDIANSLNEHKPPIGRMNILNGINDSVIIDDTYNSSPVAVAEALNVLHEIETEGVKVAVLGDMSELGKHTANEHKIVGKMVHDFNIDYLFTIGKRAEFIKEEAILSGMDIEKIFDFDNRDNLIKKLKELIKKGSVVLVKGSQMMRMEKIVKEIIKDKENAKDILVRQEEFWDN
jgi:UDP-N-acetylmuramoyl-tripeptide--D-alanyl-D-alanine ligase